MSKDAKSRIGSSIIVATVTALVFSGATWVIGVDRSSVVAPVKMDAIKAALAGIQADTKLLKTDMAVAKTDIAWIKDTMRRNGNK